MGIPLGVARGARLPSEAWTPRDWALAQAVHELDRLKCDGCGQPMWLAFDPALERKWAADLPQRCHPCTAISKRQDQYKDADHPSALRFGVRLRD